MSDFCNTPLPNKEQIDEMFGCRETRPMYTSIDLGQPGEDFTTIRVKGLEIVLDRCFPWTAEAIERLINEKHWEKMIAEQMVYLDNLNARFQRVGKFHKGPEISSIERLLQLHQSASERLYQMQDHLYKLTHE